MTLLEKTYRRLRNAGLVSCAEDFSKSFFGKNSNWYAYQKHVGREYSIASAVQCLRSVRCQLRNRTHSDEQRSALLEVERELFMHLRTRHRIADVC